MMALYDPNELNELEVGRPFGQPAGRATPGAEVFPSSPPSGDHQAQDLAGILSQAGDLLAREDGWCQFALSRGEAYCALGAIMTVNSRRFRDARRALHHSLGVPDVVDWNNAPERTQAEVVAAFRKAAALAEQVGE